VGQVGAPGVEGLVGQAGGVGQRSSQRHFVGPPGDHHPPASLPLGMGDDRPSLHGPAAGGIGGARMDEAGVANLVRDRAGGGLEIEAARVGRDATLGQHPAPAEHLVLVLAPFGEPAALGHSRVGEGDEATGAAAQQDAVTGRALAVQVDGHIGLVQDGVQGYERFSGHHRVDGTGGERQRLEDGWCGQDLVMVREGVGQCPQGRHSGEEVAQAEGPQRDQEPRHSLAEQRRRGPSLEVGEHDHLAAPTGQRGGLR
jgi:hypothetical protein